MVSPASFSFTAPQPTSEAVDTHGTIATAPFISDHISVYDNAVIVTGSSTLKAIAASTVPRVHTPRAGYDSYLIVYTIVYVTSLQVIFFGNIMLSIRTISIPDKR